jgi:hypothetical protein
MKRPWPISEYPSFAWTEKRTKKTWVRIAGTLDQIRIWYPSLQLQASDLTDVRGRAIAQAISRRLLTAAARIRAQVMAYWICGGESGTGAGFLRVLRFPLPILIPATASHSSSSIIRGWYNRPISGWPTKWTQSHPKPCFSIGLLYL